jgi:tetratricopeptide (TPR) repeat protein
MPRWRTDLAAVLFAVLGFSTHFFVPIRSAQHPFINENNPSQNLTATINFLERKQYGSQGMVERMFKRRAEWSNQFGIHRRMGFWQFFDEQFGLSGPKLFLIFVLGLFGIWEIIRRGPPTGLFVLTLLLVSTVGLILYMNFADGTRINPTTGRDYLEVRDRDYFFTAGFMVFGLAIGIGASALVQFVRDSVRKFNPAVRRMILATCLVLFGLPVYAVAGNWYYCDRSNNYVAFDYAWNLLQSADRNAVFFTGGDNDTFPLWCLQEAYGIRKDVRNVNLSLANTKWYIKQVQDYMGLNLGWSERQIDSLIPYRLTDGRVFRLQDQVVDAIIKNNPDVPINFSITTSGSSRKFEGRPIDNKLVVSGMKHRYDPAATQLRVAVDEARSYFGDTARFRYERMADPTIYKNEATLRVIANVANSLSMSAEGAKSSGRMDEAKGFLKQALRLRPESGSTISNLASIYAGYGQLDSISALAATFPGADRREIDLALAQAYRSLEDETKAREILLSLFAENPTWRPALDELMRSLVKARDVNGMVALLRRWVQFNPDDQQMHQALRDLMRQLEQLGDTDRSAP